MSLRLEMLRAARNAAGLLGDGRDAAVEFLRSRRAADGGFRGRGEESDPYYTVFAVESLVALGADPPVSELAAYIRSLGAGRRLDLVESACLARLWAEVPAGRADENARRAILYDVESFRCGDGGYGPVSGLPRGTAYHGFLAVGAYQDLRGEMPDPAALARSLKSLELEHGAFRNDPGAPRGTVPATAAATAALRHLGEAARPASGEWLVSQCRREGGFSAFTDAPLPDLLSTAVAVHALAGLGTPLDHLRGACLDFVLSLRDGEGGFRGHALDEAADCEYVYYGLLALGHLAPEDGAAPLGAPGAL